MNRYFKVVFFKYYAFVSQAGNNNIESAMFAALGLLTIFITLNILSIYSYYQCLINHSRHIFPADIKLIIITIVIGIPLYFLYYSNGKYNELYLEYQKEGLSGKKGTWITLGYTLFSICLLFGITSIKCS